MNHGTPGLPVHHQLLEFTQTHVHWVSDAIQLSHPPLSPSPPAFNLSFNLLLLLGPYHFCPLLSPSFPSGSFQMIQLFASGGQNTGVSALTSVLPVNTQDQFTLDGLVGSPCSPRDSHESSPTPQFKSINSSALSLLHSPTLTSIHDHWKNHSLD